MPTPSDQRITVRLLDDQNRLAAPTNVPRIVKTDSAWRRSLTAEQYAIARGKGTEQAFCGVFHAHQEMGFYLCVCCGLPLFASEAKFESGTGWPSFFTPVAEENIATHSDTRHGLRRTEILCARCDAHLGHVFDDGPPPTGRRYCVNSVSLMFLETHQRARFAAGCFWHVEAAFQAVTGVLTTTVGYAGGAATNPTYEQVCSGATGHAEAVEIAFDPSRVAYADLLELFWKIHDPTTLNRQGPDVGSQYRSLIFYFTPEQQAAAEASLDTLSRSGRFHNKIVTAVVPAGPFYRAEDYHQRYLEKRALKTCPRPAP